MEEKRVEVEYIPVEYIKPNPYQPRSRFTNSSLEELAASIKAYGVLQPITVKKSNDHSYELIAGERRLRASKLLGLKSIPAIVKEIIDSDSAMIALIENIQRENLNFLEEAESYQQLIFHHKLTQEQIAQKVGKTQSTIANKLRLLRLDKDIRKTLIDSDLSERHARALLRLPDEELQREALNKVISKKLNVKKTEDLIENIREKELINNHNEKLTKESRARVKSFINIKIYLNTIKNAFNEVIKTGINATYSEKDIGDAIEIKIKIQKK
ncbi:MAG: nucleoid occlusion protein [Eubacteriales bacterium]